VVFLDSTYKTNKYKAPLAIFSGVAGNGNNVIVGMVLINGETYETYKWLLKTFFQLHGNKKPLLFITDRDRGIIKAISDYESTVHLLCQWHYKRNLFRHFRKFKTQNNSEFKRLISLPDVEHQTKFVEEVESLTEFLEKEEKKIKDLKEKEKSGLKYLLMMMKFILAFR